MNFDLIAIDAWLDDLITEVEGKGFPQTKNMLAALRLASALLEDETALEYEHFTRLALALGVPTQNLVRLYTSFDEEAYSRVLALLGPEQYDLAMEAGVLWEAIQDAAARLRPV